MDGCVGGAARERKRKPCAPTSKTCWLCRNFLRLSAPLPAFSTPPLTSRSFSFAHTMDQLPRRTFLWVPPLPLSLYLSLFSLSCPWPSNTVPNLMLPHNRELHSNHTHSSTLQDTHKDEFSNLKIKIRQQFISCVLKRTCAIVSMFIRNEWHAFTLWGWNLCNG
jgi:hypothetical protein